jgi:hypothetical protein
VHAWVLEALKDIKTETNIRFKAKDEADEMN